MVKTIINKNTNDYQLVCIAIELAHKVLSLTDCKPELMKDPHVVKAHELAKQWNETFYSAYISKEGA